MTAKEILLKVKAAFDGLPAPVAPVVAAAPPAPAAPAAPSVPAPVVYTLDDGTQIGILQAGTLPAPGDTVTIAGAPAPEGVLTLQDGSLITVDATGTVTQYTPVAPAAAAAPAAPAPALPVTQAAMTEHTTKFAVGDIESRVANLEIVAKGLVESEFGYQISCNERHESTNAAISIYETTLKNQANELEAAKVLIDKYGETIKGLFELCEKLADMPVANPRTLTEHKKEVFTAKEKAEARLEKIGAAITELKKS
jgi:hypothetical protein